MKVSRDQVAANRRKILAAAARLFAERGFEAVSLSEIMTSAGLTHGGFYGHFSSKNDIVAQACAYAVRPDENADARTLLEYCASYLSPSHRDNRADGCPFAALGSEGGRQSLEVRRELTEGLRLMIDRLSRTAAGRNEAARRADAITSFSTMLGGLVLARMTDDAKLSDEILKTNREALINA